MFDISTLKNYSQLRNYTVASTSKKLAICKLNQRGSFDYDNRSGSLTKILNSLNRKDVENVFEFFDIVKNPFLKEEKKCTCKLCGSSFKTNRDGSLTRHLKEKHKIDPEKYIRKYPSEEKYFTKYKEVLERKTLFRDKDSYITCPLCNQKFKKITRSHIEFKHNMTTEEFKKKTGMLILSSKSTRKIKQKNYFEHNKLVNQGFNKVSKEEKEVREFLGSLGITSHLNKRKYLDGIEIDIFIPEKNIGIEYDGLYYHSEHNMKKTKNYHLNKTLIAEKNGIHLIHLFSDEWKFKKELVKKKLRRMLTSEKITRIFARKCTIQEIDSKKASHFLKEHHIQGTTSSTYKLGAFYNEELVGVATFSKPRTSVGSHKKQKDYLELVRYCVKSDSTVIGLLPRFLKKIVEITGYTRIISYADRRWTYKNSNLYLKTGFTLLSETLPSYWYTRYFDIRYHRYTFAKFKLKERGMIKEGQTEWEAMKEHKFDRIWDCGNLKYEWIASRK